MFCVLFEVSPRDGQADAYFRIAKGMRSEVETIDGFLDVERFVNRADPDAFLSFSTWRDEKALVRWRAHGKHHVMQAKGRTEIFRDYRIRIGALIADSASSLPPAWFRFDATETGADKAVVVHQGSAADMPCAEAGAASHECFDSVTNPGGVLALSGWPSEATACDALASRSLAPGDRARSFLVVRDYTLVDRREAPQFFPRSCPEAALRKAACVFVLRCENTGGVKTNAGAGEQSVSGIKTNPGRFFEDFSLGETLVHATPRTVTEGERALYTALYPARFALYSSDQFARACGFPESPLEDLIGFHTAFGKTVPDISLNATANLGYADCRFLKPVFAGDTLATVSQVIGLKQTSSGKTGIVYVRSLARNQTGEEVLTWVRWVMVRKRDIGSDAPDAVVPDLPASVAAGDLPIPDEGFGFQNYDFDLAGEPYRLGDYAPGETIDHVDGVTIEDAEHMIATRLWQNTAKVHFNTQAREDGRRLIYGGHVISIARALSFNGLANAQMIVAINAGAHVAPCLAGDTVSAWSEVIETSETSRPGVGAIRLRLVATKDGGGPSAGLRGEDGKYRRGVLLDLDYWALMPV